jgi:hypothetical protein
MEHGDIVPPIGNYSIIIGTNSYNTVGTTSSYNISIGDYNYKGKNTVPFTGSNNIAIGSSLLGSLESGGSANIAIGKNNLNAREYIAADNCIIVGSNINTSASSSYLSKSIFIGYSAQPGSTYSVNEIVVGNDIVGKNSNTTSIGNNNTTSAIIYGTLYTPNGISAGSVTFDNVSISGILNVPGQVQNIFIDCGEI